MSGFISNITILVCQERGGGGVAVTPPPLMFSMPKPTRFGCFHRVSRYPARCTLFEFWQISSYSSIGVPFDSQEVFRS